MKRAISIILVIWAIILITGILWKQRFIQQFPPNILVKEQPGTPFAFDEPTDEELGMLRAWRGERPTENLDNKIVVVPLAQKLRVMKCGSASCPALGSYFPGTELFINITNVKETNEWIAVPWPNPKTGPSRGFVYLPDLAAAYEEPLAAPEKSIDIADLPLTPAKPVPINPQTLVGLVCEFESDANPADHRFTRGSGAIVTANGYIITARSVIDLNYLNEGMEDYHLLNCLAGQMPSSKPLPSIPAIKKNNAFVRLPYLAYTADISYMPTDEGVSDYEKAWLDFSILKITGINPDAKYFGGPTELPATFPAAPFLVSDLPSPGDLTLNFAFPSGTTIGTNSDIRTLFMQGLLSDVTGYFAGDGRYADDLFLLETRLLTEDTAGGRFGSPIFWKGYIIGIHTAKQQESLEIYNVSAKAVLENLFDSGAAIPLKVY